MSTHYGHVDWPGICYRHTWDLQPLHCFRRSLTKVVDPFLLGWSEERSFLGEESCQQCSERRLIIFDYLYPLNICSAPPTECYSPTIRRFLTAHSTEDDSDWFLLATGEFFSSRDVQGERKALINRHIFFLLLDIINTVGRNPKGADVVYQQPQG